MTNERAIELLNRISDSQFDGEHGDERREALSMAVRALESNLVKGSGNLVKDLVEDSSNDIISRQQAIDAVVSAMIDGADAELVEGVMELLPSAQPERKKGKWISEVKGKKAIIDEYGNVTCSAHCSECGDWLTGSDEYACRGRYCPSCGARMDGESE